MKNLSTWILTMSSILYNQVMCSSDFEVFQTFGDDVKSESLYDNLAYNHNDFNEESPESSLVDLSDLERISPTPKFTLSHLYVSPEEAKRHFTRNLQPKNDYVDGYSAFLQEHFDKTDHDDYHGVDEGDEKSSKYRQISEDVENSNNKDYNDNEFERIKEQATEIKRNCKTVVKDQVMCSICKDPVSGSHSKSCSFSSAPTDKKYAYIKRRQQQGR